MGWVHINGELVHTSAIKIDEAAMEQIKRERGMTEGYTVTARSEFITRTPADLAADFRACWNDGRNMGHNPHAKPSDVWPTQAREKWIKAKMKELQHG